MATPQKQDRGENREEYVKEGQETNSSGWAILETSWVKMQQRVFTRWCNSQLKRGGKPQMENLVEDMQTGIPLMNLISCLYPDTKMPRFNKNPRMRIHKVDNTSSAISMVEAAGIRLIGTKNTHLVDKDQKMILGMVWTIISKYQIAGISEEDLNAKDALLLWCKKKTRGYNGVDVTNFTNSWCDGLALCALIHRHRPDLLDFNSLSADNRIDNLNLAFNVAEEHLDIDKLLDAEDVAEEGAADERSMVTYLSAFYHAFAGMGQLEDASRRIGRALELDQQNALLREQYEAGISDLAAWIAEKTTFHQGRDFPDQEAEIKGLLLSYGQYKSGEKAEKTTEKSNLENIYNQLQTSLSMNNRPPYEAPEGMDPAFIQDRWTGLGTEETEYVSALRALLSRLQESDILLKRWRTRSKKFLLQIELLAEDGALIVDEANSTEKLDIIEGCKHQFTGLRSEQAGQATALEGLQELIEKIHALELEETRYTANTLDTVNEAWVASQSVIDDLEAKLAAEVEAETAKDAIRREFAEIANSSYAWVKQKSDDLTAPGTPRQSDLEPQIVAMTAQLSDVTQFGDQFTKLEQAHNAQAEAGVYSNQYSDHTFEEIAALYDTLGPAIRDKIKILQNKKLALTGQQITPEQMQEFQQTFSHFDRNRSQKLNALELKSCLAALGVALEDSEVSAIFTKHSEGRQELSFDEFLPYIISVVQDTDSADQILESFKALAEGNPTVTEEQLRKALPGNHVDYIVANFPKAEDGSINYVAGTNKLFGQGEEI